MNIPYRASTWWGNRNRARFAASYHALPPVKPTQSIPLTVYSFSGERDHPEQAASIRTFLKFVGEPKHFRIISDGGHSDETKRHLEAIHPCVRVLKRESILKANLPASFVHYAATHPLGKKLTALYSLDVNEPTIYTDSDILFFPHAEPMRQLMQQPPSEPRFLLDCAASLDHRMVRSETEKADPVNSGFFYWSRPLDWTDALRRFDAVASDPNFFSEQTTIHYTLKASGGLPLPPQQYILRAEDQFQFSDHWAKQEIVLRHYISSIRTKFWHHPALYGE